MKLSTALRAGGSRTVRLTLAGFVSTESVFVIERRLNELVDTPSSSRRLLMAFATQKPTKKGLLLGFCYGKANQKKGLCYAKANQKASYYNTCSLQLILTAGAGATPQPTHTLWLGRSPSRPALRGDRAERFDSSSKIVVEGVVRDERLVVGIIHERDRPPLRRLDVQARRRVLRRRKRHLASRRVGVGAHFFCDRARLVELHRLALEVVQLTAQLFCAARAILWSPRRHLSFQFGSSYATQNTPYS